MTDLQWLEAIELSAGYADGSLDPVEVCRAALAVVEEQDEQLNAFVSVHPQEALAAATDSRRRWAAGTPLGPADGIPTSVKDIFLGAGHPTLRGSLLVRADGTWMEDAPAVARLREGGAVLLGRTTTPEFAWKGTTDSLRHGTTTNPWDQRCTPGGSSGGSAVAVACGMGPWAIGTDGGGSVRIPASFTGIVALKPTYGLIPLHPASPYGTLAHAGPMTRTVRDAAVLLDVLAVPDSRDWSHLPRPLEPATRALDRGVAGLRIAFSPDLGWGGVDPEVADRVATAVQVLADAGAEVEQVDPPVGDRATMTEAFHVLWFSGAAKVVSAYGPGALDQVDPGLAAQIRRYGTATAQDYLEAMAVRMTMGRQMGAFHAAYDALLCPTLPIPAFPAELSAPADSGSDLWTSWAATTMAFNMTGQPALSLPCGFTGAGLPVGLQVAGARHTDHLVLRIGQAYQDATTWHQQHPTTTGAR